MYLCTVMKPRTAEEYYLESKRLREETIRMADALKDHPIRFVVTNVITMDVEITKSDLKTIVSKKEPLRGTNSWHLLHHDLHDLVAYLYDAHLSAPQRGVDMGHLSRSYARAY